MRVSLNVVKQYTDIDGTIDELVSKINTQLGGVEEVIDLSAKYKDAKIVKIVTCEKHPNADKLSVCEIDAGTGEYVQVVCGAPNARAGMLTVWLPPESVVPSTFDDSDPFKLGARELRGVMSNGMLAAGDELAINSDHDGIIEITQYDLSEPVGLDSLVGKSFADVFGLNDTLLDIENKMFTHRPDCFGQLGVAREIAGIQHKSFVSPSWYADTPEFPVGEGLSLSVENEAIPRFMAVAIKDIKVGPSPLWLQIELMRMGGKSINNVVDVTNYVMLVTGQPLHAYDYDKLATGVIGARCAKSGETVALLNGKTIQLDEADVVITDGNRPIGLAGVMGGGETEVSSETKNIIIECATFDMYAIRRTAMRHGLFTDAVTRFNKGQSPLQNPYITRLSIELMKALAGGQVASEVIDKISNLEESPTLNVEPKFINDRLGLDLSGEEITQLLRNVEFGASYDDTLKITVPFWRTDIHLPEDIVEEVGRLYGFDKLPRELPLRSVTPVAKNPLRQLKNLIRETLASGGANEVLTYSFVHEATLTKAHQDPADSYKITNSLSPDLQYYRQTVLPSLLANVHANIRAGHDKFALFEMGKSHKKSLGLDHENVPREESKLAFVVASKASESGSAFYVAKQYLQFLAGRLDIDIKVAPWGDVDDSAEMSVYEPKRSGVVFDTTTGETLGFVGEFKKSVVTGYKLPQYSAGFEINLDVIQGESLGNQSVKYRPLSRYPSLMRDICFKVSDDVSYESLRSSIELEPSSEVSIEVSPIDIYKSSNEAGHKQITFRFVISNHERTLTSDDAESIVGKITNRAREKVSAEVV